MLFSVRATGKTFLKRFVFDNSREGFEKLLADTDALKAEVWAQQDSVWAGADSQLP